MPLTARHSSGPLAFTGRFAMIPVSPQGAQGPDKEVNMSTTVNEVGLTKEGVSYLRRADDVYGINIDGQNYLRVVKRAAFGDAFAEDRRVDIPVEGNGADGYFTSAWNFPWASLRAGDRVRLYWWPDANRNEALKEVGLHADALFVDITRGKQTHRYVAATQVAPDNSARMCRRAPSVLDEAAQDALAEEMPT